MKSLMAMAVLAALVAAPACAVDKAKAQVSGKDCKRLLKNAQVGAAYQAGVDVRGKTVKGANLDGDSPIQLPKTIAFDFDLSLAGKYGIADDKNYDPSLSVGKVKYDLGSGQLTFNGKPLSKSGQAAVSKACAKAAR
ncbi:hypothetical protein V5T82_06350 [Magnetovibrio sp. PR-2]|uniref:hypothetical protein n=1 Tax=Magnetovibrio sp. PR-2 TaxID=3120356 RepID=UPI002FCE1051